MRDLIDKLSEHLGLDPIQQVKPVTEEIRFPHMTQEMRKQLPQIPAATPEDQIAREAVATIEREEEFYGCAEHRLRGAYDGDTEHRIALKAIELFKQSTREGGLAKAPASNS